MKIDGYEAVSEGMINNMRKMNAIRKAGKEIRQGGITKTPQRQIKQARIKIQKKMAKTPPETENIEEG